MRIKEKMLNKLDTLGFKDVSEDDYNAVCSCYEKDFGSRVIRVGNPYCYSDFNISFYKLDYNNDEGYQYNEITEYIPQWAFTTLMKLYQMGFIEEEE